MAGTGLIEGRLRDTPARCSGGQGLSARGSGQCGSERWGQTTGGRTVTEGTASLRHVVSSRQFGGVARMRQVVGTMAVQRREGHAGLCWHLLWFSWQGWGLLHTCHLICPYTEHAGRARGAVREAVKPGHGEGADGLRGAE